MDIFEMFQGDEVFTHTDPGGITRHINTTAMIRAIAAKKVQPDYAVAPLNQSLVDHIAANHGVEKSHLKSLTAERLEVPILIVMIGDEHLIVDGSHRIVERWNRGMKDVPALIFNEGQWEEFMITGFDEPRMFGGKMTTFGLAGYTKEEGLVKVDGKTGEAKPL